MLHLNNKGQALVTFVLVMPILLLVMVLVIDIGNVIVEKQELDNVSKMVINYGLDNIDSINESNLIDLINLNTKDLSKIEVIIENKEIKITLEKNIKGIIGISSYEVVSSYIGKTENNNKRIERVG